MNSPTAADAIFNKLCETFKRHGTDEWIDGASGNATRNPGLGQRANRKTNGRAGARVRHHYSGHESEERD